MNFIFGEIYKISTPNLYTMTNKKVTADISACRRFFDLKIFYLAFFMVRTAPQETAMSASTIATALSPVGAGAGATGAVFV